ncbi:MAG: ABC transporter ATP-binding protein [Chloroflexota bacterium]
MRSKKTDAASAGRRSAAFRAVRRLFLSVAVAMPSHEVFSPSPYLPILPSPLRTLRRTLALIWQADAGQATALVCTMLPMSGLPLALAWLSKLILDRLNAVVVLHQRSSATVAAVFAAAALYVGLQFVNRLLDPIERQAESSLNTSIRSLVDRRTMATGGAIPDLDHFERKEFHDEIAFLLGEIRHRPSVLVHFLPFMAQQLLTAIGSVLLLAHISPLLPVVLIVCTIPQVVVQERLDEAQVQGINSRSEAARMMAYCANVVTTADAAKELLVYGVGPWFHRRWRRLADAALLETAHLRRVRLLATAGVVLGYGAGLALIYAGVAAGLGSHRLSVGDFALYLGVAASLQQTLAGLGGGATSTRIALRLMARWFAFLDGTRPSIAVAPAGTGLLPPPRLQQGLELRNVQFTYPGQETPVLRGVTCRLGAGETVALVGENGAGKTTLVKLLTRLYDPTAGEMLLDGIPLAAYDLTTLRQRSTVLFQDFAHFALSAQHNIGVGDAPHAEDRERILAVAKRTGAAAVLEKLPQGLDTPLTRAFEGGVDLSGGEWQKIALARAAMRDAALVILDEPTAALDAQAEYELFQRFRELAEGRTVLLISHRFSTVRMADRILVLEGGRITEAGSHDELIALGGRYAALYEMQAGRYR